MTQHRKLAIRLAASGLGTIEVNDEPVHGVSGFLIESRAGQRPKVTINFVSHQLGIDLAAADVGIRPELANELVKLGWQPPTTCADTDIEAGE